MKTRETCYHPACDITLDKQSEKRLSGAEETKCCRKVKKRGESRASGGLECGIARRDCCTADDGIVRCEHGTVVTDRSGSGVSTTGSFQDIQIVLMSLSPLSEESSGSIKATIPPIAFTGSTFLCRIPHSTLSFEPVFSSFLSDFLF